MSIEYETRVTRLTVNVIGDPIFSEQATHIELTDNAAGEFVRVTQDTDDAKDGRIDITAEEWPHIKTAIEQLLPTLGNA
jgi:hypothetical protein